MASMILGSYTFDWPPISSNIDIVRPLKSNSSVETYSTVAYFNWGSKIAGRQFNLEWEYMSGAQFSSLDALYAADEIIVWDILGDGTKRYNVIIEKLDGAYFLNYNDSYWRRNVKMTLLVISQL